MTIKVEKLNHVSIQVRDLDKAVAFFKDLFGTEWTGKIDQPDPRWDMVEQIDSLGINLCAPRSSTGATARSISRRGEGVVSIGFKVCDLGQAEAEMKKRGIRQVAKVQVGQYREIFYHPADCFGVMLCLCEYAPRKHPMLTAAEAHD